MSEFPARFHWSRVEAALLIAVGALVFDPKVALAASEGRCQPPEMSSAVACPPLPVRMDCEGTRCFFISPCHGDDTEGDGSLQSPWASLRWLTHYYSSATRPPQARTLGPGDVVYLLGGLYDQGVVPGDGSLAQEGGPYVFMAHQLHGKPDAPIVLKVPAGQAAVFDPARQGIAIRIQRSSNLRLEGLVIRNGCQRGVLIEASENVALRHVSISDTDGLDVWDVAGLYVSSSSNVSVDGGELSDNFDRDVDDTDDLATDNSGNMVIFGGSNITVKNAHFFNTLGEERAGFCLKYKTASPDPQARFVVLGNRFDNCSFFAVSTGTQNTLVRDNVIVGGSGLVSRDNGGPTHQVNQVFAYNTIYVDGPGFVVEPTAAYRNAEFQTDPSAIAFHHNIVVDERPYYTNEAGILELGTFMGDTMFRHLVKELRLHSNCYSNVVAPVAFALGASRRNGVTGGRYDIFDWKALGFDEGSRLAAPSFLDTSAGDFRLTSESACRGRGARVFR